jgi:hypothetical protein
MSATAVPPDEVPSPKRKPSAKDTAAAGLRVDFDFRLKGTGLTITRAQVAAAITALVAIGWAVMRLH